MPIDLAYKTGSAVTIGATEMSLGINGGSTTLQTLTDAGRFELWLDATAIAKGDEYLLQWYEKVVSGGTKVVIFDMSLLDGMGHVTVIPNPGTLGVGWDATLKKIAGTDRAFTWALRRIS